MQDREIQIRWHIGPGIPTVSPNVGKAQVHLMWEVAPYLRLAYSKGEEGAFYERFFNLYFVRWPQTPRDAEDIPFVHHRMECIKKALKRDLFWLRSSTTKIKTERSWRQFLRIKEAAFGIAKENEIISDVETSGTLSQPVVYIFDSSDDEGEVETGLEANTAPTPSTRPVVYIVDSSDDELEVDMEFEAKTAPTTSTRQVIPSPLPQAQKRALSSQDTTSGSTHEPKLTPRSLPRPRPLKKSRIRD
ncbi:hypothetical protein NLJ89_g8462 [Agrocybe chaxingu]|uniref:Uncharacterized protein n=1 Tax=Agrocybe chaxingu TaxID=84603 RepID=A0A9W8JXG0_9AGAR|nr:hypothetical protein NLJ89_g8462 [Agrocybe chaxingu]